MRRSSNRRNRSAQRVFEHVHERVNPRRSISSATPASIEENTAVPTTGPNADTVPSIVEAVEQPFSSGQPNQLRQLIAEAVGSQHRGPVLGNSNANIPLLLPASSHQLQQELQREGNQDGLPSTVPRPLSANPDIMVPAELPLVTLPVLPSTSLPTSLTDPSLPSLPQKLNTRILKSEYIDFNDLLSSNLYPVHGTHLLITLLWQSTLKTHLP